MADSVVSSPSYSSIRKRPARRRPTMFTEWQREKLEAEFKTDQYPDIIARERLATSLHLREDRIQVWFQNRRARHRRAALKTTSISPTTSNDDVEHNQLPNFVVNTNKRKSPCDIDDAENTPPPHKKLAVVSPSMSVDFLCRSSRLSHSPSSSWQRRTDDVMGFQRTTSRDTHTGGTSPLMSVEFLSRSSRSPSPSTSWLISNAVSTRSSFSSRYAWPGHSYIFMAPF